VSRVREDRLAAIEVAIAVGNPGAEIAPPNVHRMTDAECVQAVYDLCHARPPSMRTEDPTIRAWRRITA
jgi:hypothetical protein